MKVTQDFLLSEVKNLCIHQAAILNIQKVKRSSLPFLPFQMNLAKTLCNQLEITGIITEIILS